MTLGALIAAARTLAPDARTRVDQGGRQSAKVTGVAHDSRGVSAGSIFVAIRGQRADGILLWERERQPFFCINPYGHVAEASPAGWVQRLGERLRASPAFGPPRVSGAWHWYPLRRSADA